MVERIEPGRRYCEFSITTAEEGDLDTILGDELKELADLDADADAIKLLLFSCISS